MRKKAETNRELKNRIRSLKESLRESEDKRKIFIENIPLHIAAIDKNGKFIVWNRYSKKMLGYSPKEAVSKMSPMNVHESRKEAKEVIRVAAKFGIYDKEINLVHKDGHLVPVHLIVKPVRDAKGIIFSYYGFAEDMTKKTRAEARSKLLTYELLRSNKRLSQVILRDYDTGLYNHRYLMEILEPELQHSKRYNSPLSIIMIDIDYFKSVNDLYGHKFGDIVLRQFAKKLKRMIRQYDVPIRFSGEEFVVVLHGMGKARAMIMAQRFLNEINMTSFGDKQHNIKLKISIAVTSYPDDSNIKKGSDLIELADKILAKTKEKGGNKVCSSDDVRCRSVRIKKHIEKTDVKFLKRRIEKLNQQTRESLVESIFAFAKTIELKDHYTGEHGESTVKYATEIANRLKLPKNEIESIREAAVLHDLGKVGISEKILHKKSKLTEKEFEEVKKHPQIAADILRPLHFMRDIIPLVLYHHERWDGKGYPTSLRREEIPLGARIIALADVYQALISNRPYRKAYSRKEAIDIIKKGSGSQFDPQIVRAFLKVSKKDR